MEENHQHIIQEINPIFGQIGHIFILTAFVTAIFAAYMYFRSVRATQPDRKLYFSKLGRGFFIGHALALVSVVITMFIMIFNHHFEYHYVWSHSSSDLRMKYILSCFWEGQEGSFLLWTFWHVVLGIFILRSDKEWEKPVMSIVSLIQVFLLTFVLGIYFGDVHVGSSPFILLKDKLTSDPVFLFNDYMRFIPDGRGLNALLQNYWMVIHPPVLFLGFASITIPFAFALSGLWLGKYTEWIKPALPYALFAGMVLGTGILMGGAWAYESLSFGGFWAWDPVENASLIPWLIIVGGLHTMVVAKNTGHALRSTYVLLFLSFFFVLYSSFLTRSGILGDTSVHAFVEEGLTNHLLIFVGTFVLLSFIPLFRNWRKIPHAEKEEPTSSREFWMFVGSLVLLFSGLHVIFFTSIPVFGSLAGVINSLFGTSIPTDLAPPEDPIHFYTGVQLWVGILIAILSAFGQFFKYRYTNAKLVLRQIAYWLVLSVIATVITALLLDKIWHNTADRKIFHLVTTYTLILFAGWFSVIANTAYIFSVLKGKIRVAGGSVAHIGFALLLLGILISNAGQRVISVNNFGVQFDGEGMDDTFQRENVRLLKHVPLPLQDYQVTYLGDTVIAGATYFDLNFQKFDEETGELVQNFTVHPYLLMDNKMQQLAPNPDTRHFLTYDVFTHVTSLPGEGSKNAAPQIFTDTLSVGDTISFDTGIMVLRDVQRVDGKDTIGASAVFDVRIGTATETMKVNYLINLQQGSVAQGTAASTLGNVQLRFNAILVEQNKFAFTIEDRSLNTDWIVIKSIIFPMINLVWLGVIVMAIGFFISMMHRRKEMRRAVQTSSE